MNILQKLTTTEFAASIGFYSTPRGLYHALANNEFVDELAGAIKTTEISQSDIRNFVDQISASFERGCRFAFEISLAAICVAIEDFPNSFSEEFLIDLARVNVTEIPYASRVAAICVANLFRLPKTVDTSVSCSDETDSTVQGPIDFFYVETSELLRNVEFHEGCEECVV